MILPRSPMDIITKRVQLSRKNLALFQFLLEGYDGMVSVETLDPHSGVVQIQILPGFVKETTDILEALMMEIEFTWLLT
jgi:hypothetical protein